MESLAIPVEWHDEIISRAGRLAAPAEAPVPIDAASIQIELRNLRQEFLDERIDVAIYQQEKARLQAILVGKQPQRVAADITGVTPLLWDLAGLVKQSTPLERQGLLRSLFDRIWVEPHKIRAVTPTPSYEAMLVAARDVIRGSGPGGYPAATASTLPPIRTFEALLQKAGLGSVDGSPTP